MNEMHPLQQYNIALMSANRCENYYLFSVEVGRWFILPYDTKILDTVDRKYKNPVVQRTPSDLGWIWLDKDSIISNDALSD